MAVKYLAGERLIGTAAERAALTTLSSTGWVNNGVATNVNDVNVDTSAGNIKANNTNTSSSDFSGNSINYELSSALSNTLWTLRFSVTTSIDDSNPSGNAFWCIGFSDATWLGGSWDSAQTNAGNDDLFALIWHIADSNVGWVAINNNTRVQDYDAIASDHDLDTSVVRYYQITRNSADILGLEYHGTSGFVSDPVNTTATPTGLSSITGLDTLTTGFPWQNGATSGEWELRIDNIQIWDGVSYHGATPSTTATHSFDFSNTYPNLTNGTLFEESDTGKIYMFDGTDTWNEVT